MPTYVYRCEKCGHRFEAWQHMTDDPLTTCPQCEGPIHRILFPASVVFKGSGFYSTDHRPSQVTSESAEPAGDSAKTDTAKPDSAKTETTKSDSASPAADTPKAAPAAPAQ